ncbi:hypothetical protein ACFO5R_08935 [Halosolutus amylolyticus]|uniref:DUF8152 domain-containing protein n=1 Tax=Halosolutus amylolyticus TaxID=2932267 RepID=A0ABD5PNE7_9EURY|nr:hypothetical protein [Halosolutus amylolyticus]
MTETPSDRSDDALDERVRELHEHLAATAELPIDRTTNRWLGEAEAVARDAATSDLDPETTKERVRQVQHLLAEADDPTDDEAATRVATAREVCESILEK